MLLILLSFACRSDKSPVDTGEIVDCVPEDELCDAIDNDCDGVVDEEPVDGTAYYWDNDQDTFGSGEKEVACEVPEHSSPTNDDCDDGDSSVFPGASEVCDGVDNDCDGVVDPEDSEDAQTFYSDGDRDGYGAGEGSTSCEQPPDTSDVGGDCDDSDPSVYPGAPETWYDGVDADCAGDDDYDADADGEPSSDHGGADCVDDDPAILECRPEADCTHPSAADLESAQLNISTDLAFDDACAGWVSGIRSGTDYAYRLEPDGTSTTIVGYSNFNQQAIAVHPSSGDAVISHNDNSRMGLGIVAAGSTTVSDWVRGTLSNGSLWSTSYFNRTPGQLAWDSSGCIWAPGFVTDGSLSCVDDVSGVSTEHVTGLAHIEAVALDGSESPWFSVGADVYSLDVASGVTTLEHSAGGNVLSLAFDPWSGDLYLSTDNLELERVPADGTPASVWQTTAGASRIAISPDGYVVALALEFGSFEEWVLPAY